MKNILIFIALMILATTAVSADSGQYAPYAPYSPYGGAASASIRIDKKVASKVTTKGGVSAYVDNLTTKDARFYAGEKVTFIIGVRNTSDQMLENVQVVDQLPASLDAVEGPGNYDAKNRTISWSYAQLMPGERRLEKVVGVVRAQALMPNDQGVMCAVNQVTVKAGTIGMNDSAQFCIEKQVQAVTQTPNAGPEYGIALMALNALGLSAGIYLKKKA
ncbi:MAG: hypothetical protein ACEQSA_04530 [Weeksellaceae bacterium]